MQHYKKKIGPVEAVLPQANLTRDRSVAHPTHEAPSQYLLLSVVQVCNPLVLSDFCGKLSK